MNVCMFVSTPLRSLLECAQPYFFGINIRTVSVYNQSLQSLRSRANFCKAITATQAYNLYTFETKQRLFRHAFCLWSIRYLAVVSIQSSPWNTYVAGCWYFVVAVCCCCCYVSLVVKFVHTIIMRSPSRAHNHRSLFAIVYTQSSFVRHRISIHIAASSYTLFCLLLSTINDRKSYDGSILAC